MRDMAPATSSEPGRIGLIPRLLARGWPADRFALRPHTVVMAAVFLGALVVGVAILPGERERIAALESDGQTRRALELLEMRFARGDTSQRTLFQMQRLYEFYGETEKAREVLELLAAQRPRDASIQRLLAQLYKSMQDEPAYIAALKAQLAVRYSEPACKELIGLLRRNSDYEAEHKMLSDCRARGYRRPDDLVRLAFLEAADARTQSAAQILRAVDDRRWLREAHERRLLFSALVETGDVTEAVRRAGRWLKGQPDAAMAIDLVYKLVDANRNDLAIQLARDVGRAGDAVTLTVGEIMVDQAQVSAARPFLKGWLDENRGADLELATRFVAAAVDADDAALAMRGAERFGLDRLGQTTLVALGEALAAEARWPSFDKLRPALAAATVAANPLLSAAIELREGRTELARAYLARVRIEDLDERRLGTFERIGEQSGRTTSAGATGRDPRLIGAVPATGRAAIVGPLQAKTKQRILKRAEVNSKLREKRKVRPGVAASGPGATPPPGNN